MKQICLLLLVIAAGLVTAGSAWAIPPFNDAFKKMYGKEGELPEHLATAKCAICHAGKGGGKARNEYGKVVGKYLKKADFSKDGGKFDAKSESGRKAMAEGLENAAAEKSSSGESFGERIKAGELPAR